MSSPLSSDKLVDMAVKRGVDRQEAERRVAKYVQDCDKSEQEFRRKVKEGRQELERKRALGLPDLACELCGEACDDGKPYFTMCASLWHPHGFHNECAAERGDNT